MQSLYTDFATSIITSEFSIPFIHVSRGVPQGSILSLLLFNLCFDKFPRHISNGTFDLDFWTKIFQCIGSSLLIMLIMLLLSVAKELGTKFYCTVSAYGGNVLS